jgi:hypothetical protein
MEDGYFNSEDREHLEMVADSLITVHFTQISPHFSFNHKKENLGLACVLWYRIGKVVVINL